MPAAGAPSTILVIAAVTLAYFGAARLGFSLTGAHTGVSAVCPASGIALAAVVLAGNRMLIAVALGALMAGVTIGAPATAVLGIAVGSTVEAFIGATLLKWVGFRRSLERMRDVVALGALGGVVSTAVGATVAIGALLASGTLPLAQTPAAWRIWWLGDMGGILLVATSLFVLAERRLLITNWRSLVLPVLVCGSLAASTALVLSHNGPFVYVVFPVLFLLALLDRQRGAVTGGLVIAALAVWFTAHGHGPFIVGSHDINLARAAMFVSVGTLAALLVAAARSERLVAEAAVRRLAESERALAEAQRLAQIGSFEWDILADDTTWSDELFHIFGVNRHHRRASYQTWKELIHEDDRAMVEATIQHAQRTCEPYSFAHRIVRPDGHVRTVECHGTVEVNSGGKPVRIVGTAQDVTAVKLAEERFRSLFETAPYGLVVVDGEGRIVLVNSETERLFGYSRRELIDAPVEKLVPSAASEARPWYREPLDAPLTFPSSGNEIELNAMRKGSIAFPVEVSLTTLRTEEETLVSAAFKDVTDRKLAAEALAHQATHDPLTGLPNRTLFLDRLEHALRRARRSVRSLAVIFLDLDDFKLVNDTCGHDVGDLLLLALTPRLAAALRPGDTIARFGGDEFVVLCEDLAGEADAVAIAQRIAEACCEPVVAGGHEHAITVSGGVVLVEDAVNATPSEILRDADAAMYRAKAEGKGRVEMFDAAMRARLVEHFGVESQLRHALERGELRLFYQPVYSLDSGRIVAVEALVRWQHPERGLLEPADFMHVAQRSGLIVQIDEWVIEHACRQAVAWHQAAPAGVPLHVAVNLSPRKLARADVATALAQTLKRSGLDPTLLELEITESTLLGDIDACSRSLHELKALGVRIVLDDFGTGYSSLANLKRLTIDGLKIDRSFVDGLGSDDEDGAIIGAVLGMAEALEVGVTAEGVETQTQLARLRAHGCEFAQGFLFARPAPAEEVSALIGIQDLEEQLSA